jgi:hypothetical protein
MGWDKCGISQSNTIPTNTKPISTVRFTGSLSLGKWQTSNSRLEPITLGCCPERPGQRMPMMVMTLTPGRASACWRSAQDTVRREDFSSHLFPLGHPLAGSCGPRRVPIACVAPASNRTMLPIDHDKVQRGLSECLCDLERRDGRDNAERRAALVPDLSQSVEAASLELPSLTADVSWNSVSI